MFHNETYCYGVRVFERLTEDDPHAGAVMYSVAGAAGPWHDMVTGPLDYCWEVLEALEFVAEDRRVRYEEDRARLRAELEAERG
jgi:hypothetical protein